MSKFSKTKKTLDIILSLLLILTSLPLTLTVFAETSDDGYANNNGINFVVCTHDTTETVNYADAACTEDGYTGDEICTVRGETVEHGEAIAALGHTDDDEYGVSDVCGESLAEDEEEEETSLWNSIRCSMCDAYEAFADVPVIGVIMRIVYMSVNLARYIAYIT